MSTVAQISGDRQYIVGLASSFTTYQTYLQAQAAAITASAGASSALYYVAVVEETITVPNSGNKVAARVDLPGSGTSIWIIQVASTTTYIPKFAAENQAETTGASNLGLPVYVARCFQQVTGP